MHSNPPHKRLRALRQARPQEERQQHLAELRRASISMATQVAAFGAIGAAIGFCVLFIYGVHRNALPEFGGDEWLPQFVKLGVFCGVLVALLTIAPATDVWVQRTAILPSSVAASRSITPAHHWRYAARQAVLLFLMGTLFSVLVLFGDRLPFGPFQPIVWIALSLFAGSVAYVIFHYALRSTSVAAPARPWYVGGLLSTVTHLAYLFVLLAFLLMLSERFGPSTESQALGLASCVAILLVVVQAVFLALQSMKQVRMRLAVAAGFTLIVASAFAPEVVRMASLGNLPNARLAVERPLACIVTRYLHDQEPAGPCSLPQGDAGEPARLDVDVVLRVGSQYTVSAPGTLSSRPNDTCASVLHAPAGASAARDAHRFACVDIPRDAVKLGLR